MDNFCIEYLRQVYMENPMAGQELVRLNRHLIESPVRPQELNIKAADTKKKKKKGKRR